MKSAALLLLLCVAACTNSTTYLKDQKTGEVVTCGSTHAISAVEGAVQRREAQCIQDYKDRGFVRVPGPAG